MSINLTSKHLWYDRTLHQLHFIQEVFEGLEDDADGLSQIYPNAVSIGFRLIVIVVRLWWRRKEERWVRSVLSVSTWESDY